MTKISTRMTELFGIQYPIVQGGMVWTAGWRLAHAVSEAGGLGLIGAGSMTPELLEEHIEKIQLRCSRPYGVNIPIAHSRAENQVEVCIEKKVPIVFMSAGSPKRFTAALQGHGITVVHVVPSATLAKKAEAAGCNAVVAEGTEAGGHNGFDEITSQVLWPSVCDAVSIPVIAAGGVADGRGLASALALGADGVQVGTRFAVTEESSASEAYKRAVTESPEAAARLFLRCFMPTRALENDFVRQALEAESLGATQEELSELLGRGRARSGIFDGDVAQGDLEVGQVAFRIRDIPKAGDVVASMVQDYRRAVASLPR